MFSFPLSSILCSQGAVRDGTEAAVMALDSDAGDVSSPNLRGAISVVSSLGDGTCIADWKDCDQDSDCCSHNCIDDIVSWKRVCYGKEEPPNQETPFRVSAIDK